MIISDTKKSRFENSCLQKKYLIYLLLIIIMIFIFNSCDQPFNLIDSLDNAESVITPDLELPLTLTPGSIGLYIGSNVLFTTTGGEAPYSYSVISGSGTMTAGMYTAPGTPGTATIEVTDNAGITDTADIIIADIITSVDYSVSLINDTSISTVGGTPLSGSFTITNIDVSDGTRIINWDVFISNDTIFSNDDDLIKTGTNAQLAAGASVSVDFDGTWPETAGTYYYIVRTYSLDDILNITNNEGNSGSLTISGAAPDDIDYQVSTIAPGGSTYVTGSSNTESFTIENTGSDNGVLDIYWTAYASLNTTLEQGTDFFLASGSTNSIDSGVTSSPITLNGNWSANSGNYYLLIVLSSADDVNSLNNSLSSPLTYSLVDTPRLSPSAAEIYTGSTINFTASEGEAPYTFSISSPGSGSPSIDSGTGVYVAGSIAGTDVITLTDALGNTYDCTVLVNIAASTVNYNNVTVNNTGGTAGGSPLTGEFTFTNNGSANGTQTLSWQVYTSLDTTIGAGDTLINSGTASPVNIGITSSAIVFSGTWPVPVIDTNYYLLVSINATDDITTADNMGSTSVLVTAPVASDIDYNIQSISNSPSSAEVNTLISQSFVFYNQGSAPGVLPVYWNAFISTDQVLDGGDTLVNNSTSSPLPATTASGSININGNWPSSSGIYYLITQISSGDDIDPSDNYSTSLPFTINATASDIDYIVTNISAYYPTITAGSLCSETFDLSNIGGLNGGDFIDWTAYASSDQTIDGGDSVIGSGTTAFAGLNAGITFPSLSISGSWPSSGSYYLLVEVSSSDETIPGNNTSGNGIFTVKNPPDYTISSASTQSDGIPGTALGDFGLFDFVITENSGFGGSQPISWEVFTSVDNVLDTGDASIKSGNIGALTGGSSSTAITFEDAIWPLFGSYYNIIISISSGDDSNTTNNIYVSPQKLTVPEIFNGNTINSSSGPTTGPLSTFQDLSPYLQGGTLNKNELIRVTDIMDDVKNYFDTFKLSLGPGVSTLKMYAEWSNGQGTIDLYLWDENNREESYIVYNINRKPAVSFYSTESIGGVNLTSGVNYYIGVKFIDFNGNDLPYDLYISAE